MNEQITNNRDEAILVVVLAVLLSFTLKVILLFGALPHLPRSGNKTLLREVGIECLVLWFAASIGMSEANVVRICKDPSVPYGCSWVIGTFSTAVPFFWFLWATRVEFNFRQLFSIADSLMHSLANGMLGILLQAAVI